MLIKISQIKWMAKKLETTLPEFLNWNSNLIYFPIALFLTQKPAVDCRNKHSVVLS